MVKPRLGGLHKAFGRFAKASGAKEAAVQVAPTESEKVGAPSQGGDEGPRGGVARISQDEDEMRQDALARMVAREKEEDEEEDSR